MFPKMIYVKPKGVNDLIIGAVTNQTKDGWMRVKIIKSPFLTVPFDECILDGKNNIRYSAVQYGSKKLRTYFNKLGRPNRLTVMDNNTGVFFEHTLDKGGNISKTKEVVIDGRTITERIVDPFGTLISRSEKHF